MRPVLAVLVVALIATSSHSNQLPVRAGSLDERNGIHGIEPCLSIRVDPCGDVGQRACEIARDIDRALAVRPGAPFAVEAASPYLVIVSMSRSCGSVERARTAIEAIGVEAEPFDDDTHRSEP